MAVAAVSALAPARAAGPETDLALDLRLRGESFDTPLATPNRDATYDFAHLRVRLGLDAVWKRVTLHGVLQAVGSAGLPANAGFGIGPVYLAANRGDTDPGSVRLAELTLALHDERWRLVLGRQKWGDGAETGVGVPYLDGVKRRRMAERLVGNWDWVNVGRRFDGVSIAAEFEPVHLAGFALRPLAGGVNYRDAFEPLDDVEIYGATLTGRYGEWIPKAELRLFGIHYEDDRPGARTAAGGELSITTLGVSLLAGTEDRDLLLWVALQDGDWGPSDHRALAFIVEAGRRFPSAPGKPAVRIGLAQAGGDGGGTEHGTFFNLLPTNHKFYGSMDYSAFQNLRDLYAEAGFRLSEKVELQAALHAFSLVERSDAWYGGSGAFNDAALGFAARRPAGGFASSELGSELDLELAWKAGKRLTLAAGGGFFAGGDAAEQALPVDDDGSWTYLQLSWKN